MTSKLSLVKQEKSLNRFIYKLLWMHTVSNMNLFEINKETELRTDSGAG